MRHLNTRLLMQFTSGCLLHEQDAGGGDCLNGVRDAKQPGPHQLCAR